MEYFKTSSDATIVDEISMNRLHSDTYPYAKHSTKRKDR